MTNSEKSAKRLREFLESDKKYKQRLNASVEDEKRSIEEYSSEFIRFIIESNNFLTERLNVDRDFQGRFEKSLKDDVEEYFKVPFILEKVIEHYGSQLPLHPELDNLVFILKGWLHPASHMAIKRRTIKTLMWWLRDENAVVPELVHLFASLVPLKLFVNPAADAHSMVLIDQPEYPMTLDNQPPFYPSSSASTSKEDCITLLIEILSFITFDRDASLSATNTLFEHFKNQYLYALYPLAFAEISEWDRGEMREVTAEYGFIKGCPLPMHTIILRFVAYWLTHNFDCVMTYCDHQQNTRGLFGSAFNMQEILTSSIGNLSLLQEILRQSLSLPYSQKSLFKTSLSILRTLTFAPNEKRPLFLRDADNEHGTSLLPNDSSIVTYLFQVKGIQREDIFSYFLSSFIELIKGMYDPKRALITGMDQLEIFREGLMYIRGLSLQTYFNMKPAIWSTIIDFLTFLLDSLSHPIVVIKGSMDFGSEHNCLFMDQEVAVMFAQQLAETVYGVWMRSQSTEREQWIHLASSYSKAAKIWMPLVEEWSKTVSCLTDLLIQSHFASLIEENSVTKRPQMRNGIYEGEGITSLSYYSPLIANMILERDSRVTAGIHGETVKQPSRSSTPLPPVDQFTNWVELPWTRTNVQLLWANVMRIMGDLNTFDNPDIHETIVSTIVKTVDHFVQITNALPYDCEVVPPIDEFINVLLSVCDLPSRPYERSRSLAYAALCKVFCHKPTLPTPPQINRFYLALLNGLGDKDDMSALLIILLSSRIITTPIPGVTVIFSSILKCLAGLLNNDLSFERSCILVPAMRLLQNMTALSHLQGVSVPRLEVPPPLLATSMPLSCAGSLSFDSIKAQIKDYLLMIDLQENNRLDSSIHSTFLSFVSILLFNELSPITNSPNETLIDSYLNMLLDHLIPKDSPVLPSIIDHFYALIYHYPQFGIKMGTQREYLIIQRLLMAIRTASSDAEMDRKGQDELVSRLINLLVEWIMTLPHDWFNQQHSLREQLFGTLEECIRAPEISLRRRSSQDLTMESTHRQDNNSASKTCAEFAIVHLLHYLNNYPSFDGHSEEDPKTADGSGSGFDVPSQTIYISLNNYSIIALQQSSDARVSLVMRNPAGKFVWHTRQIDASPATANVISNKAMEINPRYKIVNKKVSHSASKESRSSEEKEIKVLPIFEEGKTDLEKTDMLKSVIKYLEYEHGDDDDENNEEEDCNSSMEEIQMQEMRAFAEEFEKQLLIDQEVAAKYENSDLSQYNPPTLPPSNSLTSSHPLPPFHHCRQLLNSLGLVQSVIEGNAYSIQVLHGDNGALSRDLKALDRKIPRELIKIALLYRGPGQEDELAVLQNNCDQVSEAFKSFRSILAHTVSLDQHRGYKGGLEVESVREGRALYWSTSMMECIIHDSTALVVPDDTEDPHLIAKKRYIGNDHVHIIWNEHCREVTPGHKGDFGNVLLIIRPLPHLRSFEVRIWRDTWVPPFGPLFDGVIVTAELLAPLIRTTAINAHRAVLTGLGKQSGGLLPMAQRAKDIAVVVSRHACHEWSKEQFLQFAMFGGYTPSQQPVSETLAKEVEQLAIN